jgi:hydroxyacylglutathione hydrolase
MDHSGGNDALAATIPGLTIVGGELDLVPACTMPVTDGQVFHVGAMAVTCLHTPGHTVGHITYYVTSGDAKHVFTGDVMVTISKNGD